MGIGGRKGVGSIQDVWVKVRHAVWETHKIVNGVKGLPQGSSMEQRGNITRDYCPQRTVKSWEMDTDGASNCHFLNHVAFHNDNG